MTQNTEVSGNEFGLSDEDYASARKEALALVSGDTPDKEHAAPIEEKAPPVEQAAPNPGDADTENPTDTAAPDSKALPTNTDPLSELPEEYRQRVSALLEAEKERAKKLEKKYDSDIGRINAYQRKYEESRRELAQLEEKLAAAQRSTPKSLKESASTPRIKEAASTDPSLVELLDEALSHQRKELEESFTKRLQAVAEPLYEARRHEAEREFNQALDSKYTNWRETVYATDEAGKVVLSDKGTPVFSEGWASFIRSQPPTIQQAIVSVNSPQEAIWALDHYVEWGTRNGLFNQPEPAPNSATVPNADAIAKKRKDDLRKPDPGKPQTPPLASLNQDDLSDERTIARLRRQAFEAIRKNDPSIYTR